MTYVWKIPIDLKSKLEQEAKSIGIPISNLLILICRKHYEDLNGKENI